jgi:hypothetical protein
VALRFPDLVRAFTTTTGIGDVTPASAVDGFRTFASQLQDQDQFYYSIISLDNPTQAEVGLGIWTTQSGSFSRQPINGVPKVDFTAGLKTCAIVVGSDWFESVEDRFGNIGTQFHGIPAGGTVGQILAKANAQDYASAWIDPPITQPTTPILTDLALAAASLTEGAAEDTPIGGLLNKTPGSQLLLINDAGQQVKLSGSSYAAGHVLSNFEDGSSLNTTCSVHLHQC